MRPRYCAQVAIVTLYVAVCGCFGGRLHDNTRFVVSSRGWDSHAVNFGLLVTRILLYT